MPRKIKLLVIEDNEDERMFIKEGLTSAGLFEVVGEAKNGNEMLELFQQSTFTYPEIVLTDLKMPGKNGYDVIHDVKENKSLSHIPVIILSTAPDMPFAAKCKQLGACAYFTKPDTFLEYEGFAQKIYEVAERCLNKH
jgi:CheY-like chemotaxis protein